jgi:hypothetical protein
VSRAVSFGSSDCRVSDESARQASELSVVSVHLFFKKVFALSRGSEVGAKEFERFADRTSNWSDRLAITSWQSLLLFAASSSPELTPRPLVKISPPMHTSWQSLLLLARCSSPPARTEGIYKSSSLEASMKDKEAT